MSEQAVAAPRNQTIFRWAGSKRQIVPTLSEYWRASGKKRYVEPFAGSACLFFYLRPEKALIGDINTELIGTYKQIKKDWKAVYSRLRRLKPDKETYYRIRAKEPSKIRSDFMRAAYFVYLNRHCFNGLYRTNRDGKFNVPYGSGGNIPSETVFAESAKTLMNATILNADFEKTLSLVDKSDFVYLDPPFSVYNKNIFTDYDTSKFDRLKIQSLREWMIILQKKGAAFLVSYLESDEADFLSQGFNRATVDVRRSIAGFSSNRRNAQEVLISNFPINS